MKVWKSKDRKENGSNRILQGLFFGNVVQTGIIPTFAVNNHLKIKHYEKVSIVHLHCRFIDERFWSEGG